MASVRILGRRVDPLPLVDILSQVRRFCDRNEASQIITLNTLMILEAEKDSDLAHVIEKASLVVPESSGLQWAGKHIRIPLPITPGIDLMLACCEQASRDGQSVFLLGGKPGIAESAAAALEKKYAGLKIAGTHHGYDDDAVKVLETIRRATPTFLFVGMNMPAQEKWIARHLATLPVKVAMGVGGSFDVLSGQLERAPLWMREAGVEWLYRVLQEPWRWRRIAQLPVFAWKVIQEERQGKRQRAKGKS